jgi:hypothetical protein
MWCFTGLARKLYALMIAFGIPLLLPDLPRKRTEDPSGSGITIGTALKKPRTTTLKPTVYFLGFTSSSRSVAGGGVRESAPISARSSAVMTIFTESSEACS